jgi:hypothetical protein
MTIAILTACGVALASDIPPPRVKVDVPALVRQLGSPDFAEREEASRRLATLDVDAPPRELLAALQSENPEVRNRAGRALRALRVHIAETRERATLAKLSRGERFARRGQIDLYIASTAKAEWKVDDDRVWVPPFDLMNRAILKGGMTEPRDRRPNSSGAWDDFKSFRSVNSKALEFNRTDGVYAPPDRYRGIFYAAIQSAGVNDPQWLTGLFVSRGPVRTKGVIHEALILATGDVTCGGSLQNAVVICDGDVVVTGRGGYCLIIARGKITIDEVSACHLVAGKTVTIAKPIDPDDAKDKEIRVEIDQNATKPLGYITFFELSTVGVEVKAEKDIVQVSSVAKDKAFAKAGIQVGDTILSVEGKRPDSAESLRRLLRDALAIGDATLSFKRDDKTLTVKVTLPE